MSSVGTCITYIERRRMKLVHDLNVRARFIGNNHILHSACQVVFVALMDYEINKLGAHLAPNKSGGAVL